MRTSCPIFQKILQEDLVQRGIATLLPSLEGHLLKEVLKKLLGDIEWRRIVNVQRDQILEGDHSCVWLV